MIKFSSKPFSFPGYPLIERALNQFRISIETFVRDVNRCPLTDGHVLKDISLTSSWAYYDHSLGRTPNGWLIISRSLRYAVAEDKEERNDKTLRLRSESAMVVDIWVF